MDREPFQICKKNLNKPKEKLDKDRINHLHERKSWWPNKMWKVTTQIL